MKRQNPLGGGVLISSKTSDFILSEFPAKNQYLSERSPFSLSDELSERSPLSSLQRLIHEQRLSDALELLEKRGFTGDVAIFLLSWVGLP